MRAVLNPTWILQQRLEFLEGIEEIARLCNWPDKEVQGLKEHLWDELISIDNKLYDVYETTQDGLLAKMVWEGEMENLRRWLSLIMGIKINYV